MIYLLATLTLIFELIGDFLFKTKNYSVGVVVYMLTMIPWFFALEREDLSKASIIFTALSVVGCVLIGYFVLGENLTLRHWVGMTLCILGVLCTL